MRRRVTRRDDDDADDAEEGGETDGEASGEASEADEAGEDREDGADGLRRHMRRRYGVDLRSVPAIAVARRAATILGVSLDGMSDAAAISLTSLRADGEWSEDDHPRAENGEFSGAGGASEKAASATERAGDRPGGHSDAMEAHRNAAMIHRVAGNGGVADAHDKAADAHEMAARAQARAVGNPTAEGQRQRSLVGTHANQASAASGQALAASKATGGHLQRRVGDPSPATGGSKSVESHPASQSGQPSYVHAEVHAANAATSASAARQLASGTNPAARSSARKAADSAALAKVAADHGDHAAAAGHAADAARHYQTAKDRAEAHRSSMGGDRQARVADPRGVKAEAQALGRQRQAEIDRQRSVVGVHPKVEVAREASARANEASRTANALDTPAAHMEAARSHGQALVANRTIGNAAGSGHADAMTSHETKAANLEARGAGQTIGQRADATSRAAVGKTETAKSPTQHEDARDAHLAAARANRAFGDERVASRHEFAAEAHEKAAVASSPEERLRQADYAKGEARGITTVRSQRNGAGLPG